MKKLMFLQFFGFLLCQQQIFSKVLTSGKWLDQIHRLNLVFVENNSTEANFEVVYGFNAPSALVVADSTYTFPKNQEIELTPSNVLIKKCVKGSLKSAFIQDSVYPASGDVVDGYQGPFFISMWLEWPSVPESKKIEVRYRVKNGKIGKIGVRIGPKGDYQLVAQENVEFLP